MALTCHENVSEMLIVNNDPDTGSFTGDGIRLTGREQEFLSLRRTKT